MFYFSKWIRRTFCLGCALATGIGPLAFAQPLGGSQYGVHRVAAHSSDAFYVTFRAGERACVYVDGDGDTDLDLFVYDENGNLIDSDADYSDTCLVIWQPSWTGTFRIVVENRGSVYNEYQIEVT